MLKFKRDKNKCIMEDLLLAHRLEKNKIRIFKNRKSRNNLINFKNNNLILIPPSPRNPRKKH